MYSIIDLLKLATSEGAEELRLHAGAPPVIVLRGENHAVEGPEISSQHAEQLLRSVADTRQIRRFRRIGHGHFIYTFQGCNRFAVHAKIEGYDVMLDLLAIRV